MRRTFVCNQCDLGNRQEYSRQNNKQQAQYVYLHGLIRSSNYLRVSVSPAARR
jgi:hypothetical protein